MLLPRSAPPIGLRQLRHPKAGTAGALQIFPKGTKPLERFSRLHKIQFPQLFKLKSYFFLKKNSYDILG